MRLYPNPPRPTGWIVRDLQAENRWRRNVMTLAVLYRGLALAALVALAVVLV